MKIEQLEIQTKDLIATTAFYQKTLGFSIIEKDTASVSFEAGTSILKFVENPDFDSLYHFAFTIPMNKLSQAIDWCSHKVELIPIEDQNVIATFENWNANAVYFYDNNGNLLELIARHTLNNAQTKPFDSTSILNLSEIGIVHENPLALGKELIQKHHFSFFAKNDNSTAFSALGTDEGLLIIVPPNRNWYPTQIPAKSNQTVVRLLHNQITTILNF
jgi:catechol 2,3-dioxygenase-like lactoylglutathione lyase family enzyme